MLTSPWRLLVALAALIGLGVVVAGVVAERSLRADTLVRSAAALQERAEMVSALACTQRLPSGEPAQADPVADALGRTLHLRVTLFDAGGRVVGDSWVDASRLGDLEPHAERPEVRAALAGRAGSDTRTSSSVGRELTYLALPCAGGGGVRVASELADSRAEVSSLRMRLLEAAGLGLLVAVAAAVPLSRTALQPIREMRRVAASIAQGDLEGRLPTSTNDELSQIAGAINQMAEQLRLRLEEATQEKEQLRAVLEGMVEGVLVVDAKGNVLLANSRLREFYDLTGEIVGRHYVEAVRDAGVDAVMREAASSDEIATLQLRAGRVSPRMLQAQAARFPAAPAPRAGTVAVFHDISELARLEEVRRDFVANASHELRTPLAAIRGFAETLLHGEALAENERRSYLEIIDRHAQRLTHIVHDLLELSTIERGRLRLEPAPLDLGPLLESTLRDWRPRFRERQLEVVLGPLPDARAFADPHAVEQVLTNLLDNAVKYTEPGGRIEIQVEPAGPKLRVRVRDTGIGIPASDLGRIFERFYRVDKARSRALGGTGLGLAIVKHLVQGMGGEISVQSRLGEGSSFAFTLPRADAQARGA